MESVKNLCGEQIAPDESIEHRLGQPVPQQGIDDFLPDSVGVVDPGGQHRLRRLAAIRPQVQVRTGGGIRPGPLPQVPQRLQALGLVLIVGVQKGDIGPPDMVKAHIPGLADAAVALLVEHPDAVILPGQLIAESRGAVGAAVIHQQQLPVGKGLPPYALHAVSEKFLRLIDRHNDGNAGHRQPPCALRRLSSVCGAETPAPSPQNLGLLHGAIVPDFPGKVNVFSRKSRAY